MSDTRRKYMLFKRREGEHTHSHHWDGTYMQVEGDDTQCRANSRSSTHKMKPYKAKGGKGKYWKFTADNIPGTQIRNNTFAHKEEVRNANRSIKKGARQEAKKEIREELENLDNGV